jgi:hypothetical protein
VAAQDAEPPQQKNASCTLDGNVSKVLWGKITQGVGIGNRWAINNKRIREERSKNQRCGIFKNRTFGTEHKLY